MSDDKPRLGVAMIGYAFMGRAHSQAWRNAHRFFDLPLEPHMAVLVGRDEGRATAAAAQLGWDAVETDWRRVLERDDVDVVDICTPGDTHAEIAVAALEAGKHVLVEKPMANTVAEAEAMTAAAAAARATGVRAMVKAIDAGSFVSSGVLVAMIDIASPRLRALRPRRGGAGSAAKGRRANSLEPTPAFGPLFPAKPAPPAGRVR